jgi:ribokinase
MQNSLKEYNTNNTSIVIFHDFFIDRIISLKSKEALFDFVSQKTKFGGGSIRGISTKDVKGGNAVNVAYCLANLGMCINLFTIADSIGSSLLKKIFSKFEDKVNLIIDEGKQGLTTIFEFPDQKYSKINIMLSDLGDNSNYGTERINSKERSDILDKASAVVILNWASNLKSKEFSEYVFEKSPKALHFIDPADIETRKEEFSDFLKKNSKTINVLSINENECSSLARSIKIDFDIDNYDEQILKSIAKEIAVKIGLENVDIHTKIGAVWSDGKSSAFYPSFKCDVKNITGAGDSWDAANIFGYLSNLQPLERLKFSNAFASLYISNSDLEPPTLNEVVHFLKDVPK